MSLRTTRNVNHTHGDGVEFMRHGDQFVIRVDDQASAPVKTNNFLALINASKKARIPAPPTGVEDHPYKFVFGFKEVTMEEQCFDSTTGAAIDFIDCKATTERYIKVADVIGGRVGDINWPALNSTGKWAVNIWELLHKSIVPDEDQHIVYGANIKANYYPPSFAPVGPGQGGKVTIPPSGDLHVEDIVVLMNEVMDKNGQTIRYFNAPGIHIGACYG